MLIKVHFQGCAHIKEEINNLSLLNKKVVHYVTSNEISLCTAVPHLYRSRARARLHYTKEEAGLNSPRTL